MLNQEDIRKMIEDRAISILQDGANRTDDELQAALETIVQPYLQLMLRLADEMSQTIESVKRRVGVTPREWNRLMGRANRGKRQGWWHRIAKHLPGADRAGVPRE